MSCNPGFPTVIQAGDVITFSLSLNGYPSSDYSAKFFLTGNEELYEYEAQSESGEVYGFVIPSVVSASIKPGSYIGSVAVFKTATGDRSVLYREVVAVRADPSATGGFGKSKWRVILEKCDAALLSLSGSSNVSFSIEGQMFTKRNLSELMKFRNEVEAKMRADEIAAGISTEKGGIKKIRTQFSTR